MLFFFNMNKEKTPYKFSEQTLKLEVGEGYYKA